MNEVTKDEFFKSIGTLDVHPRIQPGNYPYTSLWQDRSGTTHGKSVGNIVEGREVTSWYLPAQPTTKPTTSKP